MAYIATIHFYLMFAAAMLATGAVTYSIRRTREISSGIVWGLVGSAVGFAVTPLLAASGGLIPEVMVQRVYFTRPFLGCISPSAFFMLDATSTIGVLGCCSFGFWLGYRRRRTHVA